MFFICAAVTAGTNLVHFLVDWIILIVFFFCVFCCKFKQVRPSNSMTEKDKKTRHGKSLWCLVPVNQGIKTLSFHIYLNQPAFRVIILWVCFSNRRHYNFAFFPKVSSLVYLADYLLKGLFRSVLLYLHQIIFDKGCKRPIKQHHKWERCIWERKKDKRSTFFFSLPLTVLYLWHVDIFQPFRRSVPKLLRG